MYEKYDLDHKVNQFIAKYDLRLKKPAKVTDIGEFFMPRDLKNHIEAKAAYAELRWSETYYSHWIQEYRDITIQNASQFSWDKFNQLSRKNFLDLDLSESDINLHSLYRIIERGGNRTGPRRGVIFAKEFDLDVTIPIKYAVDWSDPYLYRFLLPFMSEIDQNVICPVNYFGRTSNKYKEVSEMKLGDVVSRLEHKKFY